MIFACRYADAYAAATPPLLRFDALLADAIRHDYYFITLLPTLDAPLRLR